MPIYEYSCKNCGAKFELMRSFAQADEPAACARCSSEQTERVQSACFSKNPSASGGGSSCGSCSGGSCSHCGH